MADLRYLKRRRQTWYSRVKVPARLQEAYGKAEIVRSLRTRDLAVAHQRRWEHVHEAQADFERLRRGPDSMTDADIQAEAWEVYRDTLARADADGMDEEQCDDELFLLRDLLAEGKATELDQAKLWATVAALNGRVAALRGRLYQPPTRFGPAKIDLVTLKPATVQRRASSGPADGTLRFAEAAQRVLDDLQRDPNARIAQATARQHATAHRLFTDFCGNAPLDGITKATASEFLATVAKLSPGWGRSSDGWSATLEELLDRYSVPEGGLSNRTLNRWSASCGAVFRWAAKHGLYDGSNPFEGQRRKAPQHRKTGWLPFTDQELVLLLDHLRPSVAPNEHTVASALAWVTWIAAYSGMRLEECCSLTVEDVRQQDGVWFFEVHNAKTAAGDRRVPIHSVLLKLGLVEYMQRIGSGSLWPALKPAHADQKLSRYASQKFTTVRRRLGLTRPRLSFHSLRKNVATALERARVPESEAVQVLGHERLSMSYSVYSLGLGLQGLQQVIERISYQGVKVPS